MIAAHLLVSDLAEFAISNEYDYSLSQIHTKITRLSFTKNSRLEMIMFLYLSGFNKCFHSKMVAVK